MAKDPFDELAANDPFAAAQGLFDKASSTFEKLASDENLGRLVLATFADFHSQVDTAFGKADAVSADVVILDGEDAPRDLGRIKIFQKVIVGQLNGKRRPVLGILVKKPSTQKGMSPAWVLDSDAVTEDHVKVATAYVMANTTEKAGAPA